MTLRRTANGLANLPKFFNVDLVVFCEGGGQFTPHQITAGEGDQETLDVYFWQNVFLNRGALKVHVKSIGCKSTLKSIAEDVEKNNLEKVKICFDRDHDFHLGRQLEFNCVLYTFGYSWENDVLTPMTIKKLFWRFRNQNEDAERLLEELLEALSRFATSARRFSEMEIALLARKNCGLFPREKPTSALDLDSDPPCLNEGVLTKLLKQHGYQRGPVALTKIHDSEALRFTFGHLVASYVYQLFRILLAKRKKKAFIDFSTFMRVAIGEFASSLQRDELGELGTYFLHVGASAAV